LGRLDGWLAEFVLHVLLTAVNKLEFEDYDIFQKSDLNLLSFTGL
jgi:hypothetical protein